MKNNASTKNGYSWETGCWGLNDVHKCSESEILGFLTPTGANWHSYLVTGARRRHA